MYKVCTVDRRVCVFKLAACSTDGIAGSHKICIKSVLLIGVCVCVFKLAACSTDGVAGYCKIVYIFTGLCSVKSAICLAVVSD